MNLKAIINGKIEEQKAIIALAKTEKRAMTEDETVNFNNFQTEIESLTTVIEAENKIPEPFNLNVPIAGAVPIPPVDNDPKNQVVDVKSDEYKNAWLSLMRNPQNITNDKAVMEIIRKVNPVNAITSDTGLFVPTTIAETIFSLIEEEHPLLKDVHTMHVKGNFTMNIHTGIISGDAASVPVGNCLEAEENEFVSVTLNGYQYGKLVEIPWAMRAMNIAAWETYLTEECASRLGAKLATDVIYGGGKDKLELTGIDPTLKLEAGTPQIKTYIALEYADLTWLMTKTSKPKGQRVIYTNEDTYWSVLSTLRDEIGRPLFIADPATGVFRSVFGVIVKIESAIKENDILAGKPYVGYLLNYNKDITTVAEDEAKCLRTNIVSWCVADGAPVTTKAWAILTKTAGFLGLKTLATTYDAETLNAMTKAELLELAISLELEVNGAMLKEDLVTAILESQ